MPNDIRTKICGLTRSEDVVQACAAGAAYLGFNFFPPSPRYISLEMASQLMLEVPADVAKVALVVDADDVFLDGLTDQLPVDILQLHGGETPDRVAQIKARYGLPVMKAVGVATSDDLPQLGTYGQVADMLLVDAKPPKGADRPGGNAVSFDWKLITGRRWPVLWLLAGGLTPENVAEAIRLTGAKQVDVSSGVESAPGVKDATLMHRFIDSAKA